MSKTVECPACSKVIALKGVPAHTRKCPKWDSKIGIPVSEFNFDHHYKRGLYADGQVEGVDYCECLACSESNKVHRLKRMSQHLKKVHGMSVDEYLGKYPKGRVRLQSTLDRRVATNLDKYGVENVFQSENIKRKSRKTMVDRYGAEHNNFVESIVQKREETNLKRYGVANVFSSSRIQEKARNSMLRNHGVASPQQSPEIRARTIATTIKKYGSEYYFTCDQFLLTQELARIEREKKRREDLKASGRYDICPHCDEIFSSLTSRHKAICEGWPETEIPEHCLCGHESTSGTQMKRHRVICKVWQGRDAEAVYRSRRVATCLSKYGFEHATQHPEVKKKIVDTNLARYGAPSALSRESNIYDKIKKSLEGTYTGVLGDKNIFAKPWGKERVIRTCLPKVGVELPEYETEVKTEVELVERYGITSPMHNRDYSRYMLDIQGKNIDGPNKLEKTFNELNPELIFTGDHTFWRWLPRLMKHKNPDFLVPGPDPEHPRRDLRKVVEVFGDYWHSEQVTGQDPTEHCKELVDAYSDVGIQCLIVWENDIRKNPNGVRTIVSNFLSI